MGKNSEYVGVSFFFSSPPSPQNGMVNTIMVVLHEQKKRMSWGWKFPCGAFQLTSAKNINKEDEDEEKWRKNFP